MYHLNYQLTFQLIYICTFDCFHCTILVLSCLRLCLFGFSIWVILDFFSLFKICLKIWLDCWSSPITLHHLSCLICHWLMVVVFLQKSCNSVAILWRFDPLFFWRQYLWVESRCPEVESDYTLLITLTLWFLVKALSQMKLESVKYFSLEQA